MRIGLIPLQQSLLDHRILIEKQSRQKTKGGASGKGKIDLRLNAPTSTVRRKAFGQLDRNQRRNRNTK